MNKIKILGISINTSVKEDILAKIKHFLSLKNKQHYLVTPNPEIILAAQKDEELLYILNKADLSLPDGMGVKLASFLCGENIKRISGSDITFDILSLAEKEQKKVGIFLWSGGWSRKKETEKALKKKYKDLTFAVEEISRKENIIFKKYFIEFAPEIVFVGLGSPWQEKFIYSQLKNIPSAKIALAIGGTFDYLTGKKKRAPKFMRAVGLEWLWRFIFQPTTVKPSRIERIWNATMVFSWEFFKNKFVRPFFYRPNISYLLYKKEIFDNKNFNYKILLVERSEWLGHWQLPQGGTDGEQLMEAGERELKEELNTDKFLPKRVFPNIYRYVFPKTGTEPDSNVKRISGYKGQKQSLFIAEFTGQDKDIKVNYWDHSSWKWVDMDSVVDNVHVVRKRSAQIFLKKFKEFVKQN